MKRIVFFVLFLVLIVGSISFAKEGDLLEFYQANQTYQYDLDGNGKLDFIKYGCIEKNHPVLYINQDMFTFDHARPEAFLKEFKIVDLDKSDKYSEIAIGFAIPPHDKNAILFYRYTPSGGHYIGDILGDFEGIGSNIMIKGDGTIISAIDSESVEGASYQIHYRLTERNKIIQTSRPDIYYYQKRLQKNLKGNLKFYQSINSKEFRTFDDDVKATLLGELNGWVWVDVEGDVYWLKGSSLSQTNNKAILKSYDQIFEQKGLLGCIDYFDDNYDYFTPERRNQFAAGISWEIDKRGRQYNAVNYIEAASIPAPPVKSHVNSLYPGIYDGETNTLLLDKLDNPTRQAIQKIAQDQVFIITKVYFIMEEYIEDSGFQLTIHPEIYTKLKRALDLTFKNQNGVYKDIYGNEVFGLPQITFLEEIVKATDKEWNSNASYPELLVEDIEKLELLKGAWKTNAYIPVSIEGYAGNGDISNLKSYDQIYYQEGGLMACLNYFDTNYDKFSEKARITFAEQLCRAINDKGMEYSIVNDIRHKVGAGPYTLENVNSLYPGIYDRNSNTLSIQNFDDETATMLKLLKKDDIFMLAKSYFVMEDEFNDNGFRLVIHPNTYKKLKRALDLIEKNDSFKHYADVHGTLVYGLDLITMPDELVTKSDVSWSSENVYPKVFVEIPEQLKLLEGGWKVEIYLPVNIQNEALDNKVDGSSKLSGYTAENINGTKVNYSKYTGVVAPMYDGVNKNALTTCMAFVGNNNTTTVNFAIFGEIENLKIMHTRNEKKYEYRITKLGSLKNSLISIKTELPTKDANIIITGHVKTGSGDYKSIKFVINKTKKNDQYQPILIQ